MYTVLLAIALFASLLLIPLGFPGTWLMVGAAALYAYAAPGAHIGVVTLAGCAIIALVMEMLDIGVAAQYTRRYGGSPRGAWGAIVGGLAGAVIGLPVPVIGSVLGAIVGSFAGALVGEYSSGAAHDVAARAAVGAAIGRAVAMGLKAGAGVVIAVWVMAAALMPR